MPLYGCDCYAYALLASGFVDLVIESGLKVSCTLSALCTLSHFVKPLVMCSTRISLSHLLYCIPLQPYDFLSLIPVIEGAGGVITDWGGHQLQWEASIDSHPKSKLFMWLTLCILHVKLVLVHSQPVHTLFHFQVSMY